MQKIFCFFFVSFFYKILLSINPQLIEHQLMFQVDIMKFYSYLHIVNNLIPIIKTQKIGLNNSKNPMA